MADVRSAGARFRREREARHLTQRDVERSAGIPNGVISTIENGIVARPPMDTVVRLGAAYGMTPNEVAELYGFWTPTTKEPGVDERLVRVERVLERLDVLDRERLLSMIELALEVVSRPA